MDQRLSDPAGAAPPEPEVVGPTDQELADAFAEGCRDGSKAGEPPFLGGARAVLARWGRPAPAAEGEVAELVAWLHSHTDDCKELGINDWAAKSARAADLLGQRQAAPVPVAVSERPWEREGWCDDEGRCWAFNEHLPAWEFLPCIDSRKWADLFLPAHALPLPSGEVE